MPWIKGGIHPELPFQKVSTSAAAALAAEPTAGTVRAEVLDYLRSRGKSGATDDEIEIALGRTPSSLRPRRRELQLAEYIYDSGLVRKTRTGRKAIVWMAQGR